ncbi:VanZ family protein [Lysinibacillus louembei]|uniref:VanZ family protein n=1 Tax=Lysinibacillus louembei TaxID=1470088 RepID=A0ABZ0RSK6_9BACI|nr:VanZ family protein [Lysinibacillus louembei]WPK11115.1 VanZ family protein [Lysinibacillus louembei]
MDLISIVFGLLPYVKYSIFIIAILMIGYFIYRKFYQRKYPIRFSKFVFITLLICWFIVVLGITTLSRGARYTGQINFDLFTSYINAWNAWSLTEFQLIIFNMLMFVPLGVLLPLIHHKNKSFWRVLVISIIFTACIEMSQLITGKGIFELDDLLHNTIGSLAGYFIVMVFILWNEQRKLTFIPIVKAISIPLVFIALFGVANGVYNAQEFGNLPFKPAQKQNMEHIKMELETELSNKSLNACVYYNKDVNDVKKGNLIAQSIAKQFNLQQQGGMRIDGDNRIFTFQDDEGNAYYLTYFMSNGSWSVSLDNINDAPLKVDIKQQKQLLENWLKNEGLLPNNAIYQQQDERTIRWDLAEPENLQFTCEDFSKGLVMISLFNQPVPDILFDISDNEMVAKKQLISQQQAYNALVNGEFSTYQPLQKGDTLTIKNVRLTYTYDTKGYYQPVYVFTCNVNDQDYLIEVLISAIQ